MRRAVQNASTGSLDSAWKSFELAVKDIPNALPSDAVTSVQQAGQQLHAAAQSTASSLSCW